VRDLAGVEESVQQVDERRVDAAHRLPKLGHHVVQVSRFVHVLEATA